MSETLGDFRTRVQELSRVPVETIGNDETDKRIAKAVVEYSKKLPLVQTVQLPVITGNTHLLSSVVTGWDRRHSVREVLAVNARGKRVPLDGQAWQVQETQGVYSLHLEPEFYDDYCERFTNSSEQYLEYSYPHTLSASVTTVRDEDLDALAALAASYCCTQAAAEASDQSDSTYTSDVVDYQGIADKLHKQARAFMKIWKDHVKEESGGRHSVGEWDLYGSRRGRLLWKGSRRF